MQSLIEEIRKILEEPDVFWLDWEMGKTILANWKATLPERIVALITLRVEKDKEEALAEAERQLWKAVNATIALKDVEKKEAVKAVFERIEKNWRDDPSTFTFGAEWQSLKQQSEAKEGE